MHCTMEDLVAVRDGEGSTGARQHLEDCAACRAALESALQQYDADGRVVSGRSAALAAQLEDRIAAVDGQLSQLSPATGGSRTPEAKLVDLWKQRATLMQQLYQVRVTRVSYVGL